MTWSSLSQTLALLGLLLAIAKPFSTAPRPFFRTRSAPSLEAVLPPSPRFVR
jgi:hypothetical protein